MKAFNPLRPSFVERQRAESNSTSSWKSTHSVATWCCSFFDPRHSSKETSSDGTRNVCAAISLGSVKLLLRVFGSESFSKLVVLKNDARGMTSVYEFLGSRFLGRERHSAFCSWPNRQSSSDEGDASRSTSRHNGLIYPFISSNHTLDVSRFSCLVLCFTLGRSANLHCKAARRTRYDSAPSVRCNHIQDPNTVVCQPHELGFVSQKIPPTYCK